MSKVQCPLCSSENVTISFSVKDYTVSSTSFNLAICKNCGFLFTENAPDIKEIGKYYQSDDYISHSNSNKGFLNAIYQIVRKRAVSSKRNLLISFTGKGKGSMLDYGCGTGTFLSEMKTSGWAVQGIEPDPGARSKAIGITGASVEEPSFLSSIHSDSVDAITMWHVLEHVHDLHQTLGELIRILKRDGVLIIAVPNHRSYDAAFYGKYWAAYDVPRHLYHFSPATMKKLMSMHGLTIVNTLPMWYDSFYVSLLSEKYKHGKSRLLWAMAIGFISNIKAFFKPGVCSSQIYIIKKY
jgi:2-polyprenyl-3-methyl-5-hydroxy-6-metoxy-1,4-benzoquinol methylase